MTNNNIVHLRVFALICIIMHHCFSIYQGWPPTNMLGGLPVYALYLSGVLKYVGLGIFTYISGFCLYYSVSKRKPYIQWLVSKTIHLLLPMVLFAVAYYYMFPQYMFDEWCAPINGTHLWYLPMLYICLIICSISGYSSSAFKYAPIFIYILIFLLSYFHRNRTIEEFIHYFPVFCIGYYSNEKGLLSKALMGGRVNRMTKIFNDQSFNTYLLHQFYINLLLVLFVDEIGKFRYYWIVPTFFVMVTTFSLLTGLGYNYLYYKIKKALVR